MKIKDYITEAKEIDFQKGKEKISKNTMKDYHDALFDIVKDYRESAHTKDIDKNEKTQTILFLLMSALKEMKSYIDKE